MTTQLDAAYNVHTRFTGTAPEGVIPQPWPATAAEVASPTVPITRGVPAPRGPVAPSRSVEEVDALWEDYKASQSPRAREGLILHYAPLVSAVAGRVGMRLPSTVEQADLVSYGMFGLIDAIEKYQTDRAVKFESYASSRIRGAIIDELRAMDWVPRSVRTKARSVDRAYAELEAKLHRTPTEDEVARHLEMPVEDLRAIYSQLSTVNVAGWFTRTRPTSASDTLVSTCILVRSCAMRNNVGADRLAATVWPTSTFRDTTTPSTGAVMLV